jgi:hypothetical protein
MGVLLPEKAKRVAFPLWSSAQPLAAADGGRDVGFEAFLVVRPGRRG